MKTYRTIINEMNIIERIMYDEIVEAFGAREVKYGTNFPEFDNAKLSAQDITYFWFGNKIVRVNLTNQGDAVVLKFAVSNSVPTDATVDKGYLTPTKGVEFYGDTNHIMANVDNPLRLFNSVIYVLLSVVNKNNINTIAFEGADEKLKSFYNTIVKNDKALSIFKKHGFEYNEKKSANEKLKMHVFTRVNNES